MCYIKDMETTRKVSEMKKCTKCKASKALAEFGKRKASKDGLKSICKACTKAKDAAYYAANKEKAAAKSAAWAKANPEKAAARNAAWYASNKERKAATSAAWKAANKDSLAAAKAAWKKNNPEKKAADAHRRRARKASNGVNLVTAAETAAIIAQPCMACDAPAPSTVEHLIPINRGGAHTIGNLAPLCLSCNSSKCDLTWAEWKYSNRAQAKKAFGR